MDHELLKNHRKAGRPSILSNKLTLQIRALYFSGLNIKNIQLELGINPKTWEGWHYGDIQGFRSKFNEWRKERVLDRAENNISDVLELDTKQDPALMRLKFSASVFVAETLGKESYSKKVIQEDPNATTRAEMDEIRQNFKRMMSIVREKNHGTHKEKMKAVI
jgi:hypothetical protein